MSEAPTIDTWHGQRIETLSREELIEALRWCGSRMLELDGYEATRARALGKVEMMKRGELAVP